MTREEKKQLFDDLTRRLRNTGTFDSQARSDEITIIPHVSHRTVHILEFLWRAEADIRFLLDELKAETARSARLSSQLEHQKELAEGSRSAVLQIIKDRADQARVFSNSMDHRAKADVLDELYQALGGQSDAP